MRFLTTLLCMVLLAGCNRPAEETEPTTVVAVKVARADVVDLPLSVQAPATVYPREQASIASRITAPIRTLLVKKGDTVTAGQLIARLENRDLVAQRGEALNRAQADLSSAEAALTQARNDQERRKKLFDQGALPYRDLLTSQTEFAQATANYEVARKYVDLLEGATSGNSGTALVNAQLAFTEIRTPFAGVLTEQFLYPGDMAKPDTPIFTVMDLSVAVARAQVPETAIAGVARGQACSFAGGDSPEPSPSGRVSMVNQSVDPSRRTIEVWCEVANASRALRAGMFGTATIFIGKADRAVVLPESAVQFTEASTTGTVLVVDPQHVAHVREVEAVRIPGGRVHIVRGIEAGETVVVEGGYGLPDGAQVSVAEVAR